MLFINGQVDRREITTEKEEIEMEETKTPLQKLDDAVHEFVNEIKGNPEVTLSGWVLSYQGSSIESNPAFIPLTTARDFTFSPSTTAETALGLTQITSIRHAAEMVNPLA